jgi:hypothetical protein
MGVQFSQDDRIAFELGRSIDGIDDQAMILNG